MDCKLAPGGARKMQTLARLTGSADPNPKSVWLLKDLCDKFSSPTPPSPQRPLFASSTNQALRRARTCLEESTDDEEMLGDQPNSLQVTRADLAKAELDSVLQLMDANKKMDALDFWKQQKSKFPLLTLVACTVLGAVGTSAAAERDVSTAGNIMTPNRSTLSAEHQEMHCLIRGNAQLLPTLLSQLPILSSVDQMKMRAEMPLAGSRQAAAKAESTSSEDDEPADGIERLAI